MFNFKRVEKIYDCSITLAKPPNDMDMHTPTAPQIFPNKNERIIIIIPIIENPIAWIFTWF